jgi:hypothetical protein
MELTDFIIIALATWRVSNLITYEMGPYDVFDKFRAKIGIVYDEYGNPYGQNELANLVKCLWCLSIWIGVILTIVYVLFDIWILIPFAASAVAVIASETVDNDGES